MAIYLDYNASAPIDHMVLQTMNDVYLHGYGNAESRTHDFGDNARKIVETARKQVAALLGIQTSEVFFTSGSTESDNIAILGLQEYAARTGKKHIITTSIEHKAVLNAAKHMKDIGFDVDFVDPLPSGRVDAADVLSRVRDDTLLVSVMHVNNETGIIQPVKEIGDALMDSDVLFHIDATQSCGKLVKEIQSLNYDMMSIAAHKMQGPQGIGALILRRKHYKLPPVKNIIYGGPQEHGVRPGTTPVALAAGFGKACEIALNNYEEYMQRCTEIKSLLMKELDESSLHYSLNGDQSYCMPTTVNVCIHGVSSEALMLATKQYCALSNGSACNANSYEPSYVLTAMGIPEEQIEQSVRISWGHDTDRDEFLINIHELIRSAESF